MRVRVALVFVAVALLSTTVATDAAIISYTGKFKIHQDKCFRQVEVHGKGFEWEELECIRFMEDAHTDLEVLNVLSLYHKMLKTKHISNEQYLAIVERAMLAMGMRSYQSSEQVLKSFHADVAQIVKTERK